MSDNVFTDIDSLKEFMTAGKAKVTVKSLKSGKHFTYKISRLKESELFYVSRLGSEKNYYYLGTIFPDIGFRATRKTPRIVQNHDDAYIGFEWLWNNWIRQDRFPPNVEIQHEGRCAMCGIELTDPVSIKEGYGPECRKKRLRRPMQAELL